MVELFFNPFIYPDVLSISERSRVRSRKTESGVLGILVPPVPVPESPVASPFTFRLGLRIDSSSSSSSSTSLTGSVFSIWGLGDRERSLGGDRSLGGNAGTISDDDTTSDWTKESSSVASCVVPGKFASKMLILKSQIFCGVDK